MEDFSAKLFHFISTCSIDYSLSSVYSHAWGKCQGTNFAHVVLIVFNYIKQIVWNLPRLAK